MENGRRSFTIIAINVSIMCQTWCNCIITMKQTLSGSDQIKVFPNRRKIYCDRWFHPFAKINWPYTTNQTEHKMYRSPPLRFAISPWISQMVRHFLEVRTSSLTSSNHAPNHTPPGFLSTTSHKLQSLDTDCNITTLNISSNKPDCFFSL